LSVKVVDWLLFVYQLPANPSTHRSYVWRKLKALGSFYLQNSTGILPQNEKLESELAALRAEIEARGGSSGLYHIELTDEFERRDIQSRFEDQMNDEYGEFLERCQALRDEFAKERTKKHFTFGELEENEAELEKLRSWLPKLLARDFFEVPLRERAVLDLKSCEDDFRLFESEVEAFASVNPSS